MKTNSLFNFNRFGRLMVYDLRINGITYLLQLATFTLLMYLWMLIQMRNNAYSFMWQTAGNLTVGTAMGYMNLFLIGLLILGVFIGTSFTVMGNKVKCTSFLLIPASTMEKYLHQLFVRGILGTGLFFLIFWMDAQLARLTFEQIPIGSLHTSMNGVAWIPDVFDYSMIFRKDWLPITFGFISMGSFLFACPLFFRKLQLPKTIVVFFAGIFLTICLFVLFSHLFYPGQVHGFNVQLYQIWITKDFSSMELAASVLVYVSWLFFLLIGYFRLKESTQ